MSTERRRAAETERRRKERELDRIFARIFTGRDGEVALAWLGSVTFGRVLGPEASTEALRHLEGQRYIVQTIMERVTRGRQPAD